MKKILNTVRLAGLSLVMAFISTLNPAMAADNNGFWESNLSSVAYQYGKVDGNRFVFHGYATDAKVSVQSALLSDLAMHAQGTVCHNQKASKIHKSPWIAVIDSNPYSTQIVATLNRSIKANPKAFKKPLSKLKNCDETQLYDAFVSTLEQYSTVEAPTPKSQYNRYSNADDSRYFVNEFKQVQRMTVREDNLQALFDDLWLNHPDQVCLTPNLPNATLRAVSGHQLVVDVTAALTNNFAKSNVTFKVGRNPPKTCTQRGVIWSH